MIISKRTARVVLIGAIIAAALVYLVFANSLSETDMVRLSYIWLPIAITGAAILFTGKNTLKFAISWFITAVLGLFVFFELIFPML